MVWTCSLRRWWPREAMIYCCSMFQPQLREASSGRIEESLPIPYLCPRSGPGFETTRFLYTGAELKIGMTGKRDSEVLTCVWFILLIQPFWTRFLLYMRHKTPSISLRQGLYPKPDASSGPSLGARPLQPPHATRSLPQCTSAPCQPLGSNVPMASGDLSWPMQFE